MVFNKKHQQSETDNLASFCFGFFLYLPYLSLFFLNLPIADSTLGAIKTDTDFYQSLAFCMIW